MVNFVLELCDRAQNNIAYAAVAFRQIEEAHPRSEATSAFITAQEIVNILALDVPPDNTKKPNAEVCYLECLTCGCGMQSS